MNDDAEWGEVERVAIVGMTGRFPGAGDLDEFWDNLKHGIESVSRFTDDELLARGVPAATLADPGYVKAGTVLDGVDMFDAQFFGFSPREARLTDPQHRVFFEAAWQALESAGYDPERFDGSIGVFAGVGVNNYAFRLDAETGDSGTSYQRMIANDRDFLATRVSYLLNLTGPSFTVQTACSTSAVAVHLASQSLLTYQADMALAGGVSLYLPQGVGYTYQPGMILSPDGHCRAFDANGQGIVSGRGLGIVVLKRLSEAVADGDTIHAVIRGTAINNDGSAKIGYTAPSIDGQAEVIATAMALADVEPATIQYIEAHGTGTALGDPIEVAALQKAFGEEAPRGSCAIGSVKTNIGHLDAAAGVTGLIKTVLALKHRQIPPSINFEVPNPEIDFEGSPFYVNAALSDWPEQEAPRRAGVSSFGIGGTNAHIVVEEAPPHTGDERPDTPQVLVLAAKTESALEASTDRLAQHLADQGDMSLANAAHTLQVGRRHFEHRRVAVVESVDEAASALLARDPGRVATGFASGTRTTAFLFSGQGAQHVNMGRALYGQEAVFREQIDDCAKILETHLGRDIRSLLYPSPDSEAAAAEALTQTAITQPALFTIEYALAQLWRSRGIEPTALAGHSIGEYVAACLAGVFSLEDALGVVSTRGRLMQNLPAGAMLAVPLGEDALLPLLGEGLSLAAVNAPGACVVSGGVERVAEFERELSEREIEARPVRTSHAFHSSMMDPIIEPFTEFMSRVTLGPPTLPFTSNITGTWITADQAMDPGYWALHVRSTVRFGDCAGTILQDPGHVLLEVGPGNTLANLIRRRPDAVDRSLLASLPHPSDKTDDLLFNLRALGHLWLEGLELDWSALHPSTPTRISLPTYPFDRQRYWIEEVPSDRGKRRPSPKTPRIDDWFYAPTWIRTPLSGDLGLSSDPRAGESWLMFLPDGHSWAAVAEHLSARNRTVALVRVGERFTATADGSFTIDPRSPEDYRRVLESTGPDVIVHGWATTASDVFPADDTRGFPSLIHLTQALDGLDTSHLRLALVTSDAAHVLDGDGVIPGKLAMRGAIQTVPQEFGTVTQVTIDVRPDEMESWDDTMVENFLLDVSGPVSAGSTLAYRGRQRWIEHHHPIALPARSALPPVLRKRGVYLITGGLGGVGFSIAEHLARRLGARLVLVGRSHLPPREEWPDLDGDGETGRRIRRVLQLEAAGAEVLTVSADVSDRAQMAEAVDRARGAFGEINGVIHAAGTVPPPGTGAIRGLTANQIEEQLRAKTEGLVVLGEVLSDVDIDFCFLTSSLSSVLGGLGLAAYSAANLFMDGFAAERSREGSPWFAVDWDAWELEDRPALPNAMTATEGLETFERLLWSLPVGRLVVSTGSLEERIDDWIRLRSLGPEGSEDATVDATDVDSLPPTDWEGSPRTDTERRLSEIWQDLLGIARVGIFDNFFDLGGDSLLATSVAARASKHGIRLSPQDLLEHPTIHALGQLSGLAPAEPAGHSSAASMPMPPNLHRFLEERNSPDVDHWNVSALLTLPSHVDLPRLEAAAQVAIDRHDALRVRLAMTDQGWHVQLAETAGLIEILTHDLSTLTPAEQQGELEAITRRLHGGFDLADGPVFQLAHFDLGSAGHRLFVVTHHFVGEGMSLAILLEDLETAYGQVARAESVDLPRLPMTVQGWAERLDVIAQSTEVRRELDYWLSLPWAEARGLPSDFDGSLPDNTNASAQVVGVSLSTDETGALTGKRSSGLAIEEVLIASLAQAVADLHPGAVHLERLGHGRIVPQHNIDLSRTVGFFLSYTPLVLDVPSMGEGLDLLRNIALQIREGNARGYSFDLLKWMSRDEFARQAMQQLPRPQLSFNYRGRIDHWLPPESMFEVAPENHVTAHNHSPRGLRYYPISVVSDIENDLLTTRFVYSTALHSRESVESLAERFGHHLRTTIAFEEA